MRAGPRASNCPGAVGLPRFGVLTGWYDGGSTAGDNGVMALAGVESAVGSDAADLLVGGDMGKQCGPHGRIADITGGELRGPDFRCLLVNSNMDLAPDTTSRATMLACIPFTFPLDLDPGAVDQEMHWPVLSSIGYVDLQGLLAAAQRAEVWHSPVQFDQLQQALDEPSRLPECHAEHHLHGQAGLDVCVTVVGLPATFAACRSLPDHGRIKPNCQRAAALRYRRASSRFCRLRVSACSYRPATTLDPLDKSPTGFVQQSRADRESSPAN